MSSDRTGRTSFSGCSQGHVPGGRTDTAGNHWKTFTAKRITMNTATTYSGSELATSAATDVTWSTGLSRRRAASAPDPSPTMAAMTLVIATSTAELTSFGATYSTTSLPLTRDVPNLPCTAKVTQPEKRVSTGSSRCRRFSRAATLSGVAFWPNVATAALPGSTVVAK